MKKFFDGIAFILKFILALLVGVNAVTICVSVFCRFVINSSLGWPDELAAVSLAWITFLGAALATVENKHISMKSFAQKFGSTAETIFESVSDLLMIVMSAILHT